LVVTSGISIVRVRDIAEMQQSVVITL